MIITLGTPQITIVLKNKLLFVICVQKFIFFHICPARPYKKFYLLAINHCNLDKWFAGLIKQGVGHANNCRIASHLGKVPELSLEFEEHYE